MPFKPTSPLQPELRVTDEQIRDHKKTPAPRENKTIPSVKNKRDKSRKAVDVVKSKPDQQQSDDEGTPEVVVGIDVQVRRQNAYM